MQRDTVCDTNDKQPARENRFHFLFHTQILISADVTFPLPSFLMARGLEEEETTVMNGSIPSPLLGTSYLTEGRCMTDVHCSRDSCWVVAQTLTGRTAGKMATYRSREKDLEGDCLKEDRASVLKPLTFLQYQRVKMCRTNTQIIIQTNIWVSAGTWDIILKTSMSSKWKLHRVFPKEITMI